MASGWTARVECERVCVFKLIVLAALLHAVKVEKVLDMAPDALDDSFSQCGDKMLKAVTDVEGLLQKELSTTTEFNEMWNKNTGLCKKTITGGTSHHLHALQAYANSKPVFRKRFNNLVYSKGGKSSTYREEFPFKSLHFLLTDSLRLLNPNHTCKTVYYGTTNKYTAQPGTEVRFGKFLRAKVTNSSETEVVEENGGSLFKITSCSVGNVEENTCKSEELQCLISPAEVFIVQEVREHKDDEPYKEITLIHSRFLSNHDCHYFHRNAVDVSSSISLMFILLSLMASVWSQCTVAE